MKQIKWFEHKFEFSTEQNIFPSILERLKGIPVRLKDKMVKIPQEQLTVKPEGSWSILENIGHLLDLEVIWFGRLEDILNGEKELRHADLQNKKTDLANHNSKQLDMLIKEFSDIRKATVDKLDMVSETDVFKYALHPRLKTPMRIMDLFLFVAEHDDHHMVRITEINKLLTMNK